MMSYMSLYGLFVLTSILLSNCLILLARYVRQMKEPPKDADFEHLLEERRGLETTLRTQELDAAELQRQITEKDGEQKKLQEKLDAKIEELRLLKQEQQDKLNAAAPEAPKKASAG